MGNCDPGPDLLKLYNNSLHQVKKVNNYEETTMSAEGKAGMQVCHRDIQYYKAMELLDIL